MCAITTVRGLLALALVLGAGVAGAATTPPSVFRALLGLTSRCRSRCQGCSR